jgi:hypothetical protein
MELYFYKTIRLAKLFKLINSPDLAEIATAGVQSCFAAILKRGMFEDAYSIGSAFQTS